VTLASPVARTVYVRATENQAGEYEFLGGGGFETFDGATRFVHGTEH